MEEQLQSFDIEDIMKRIMVRIEEIWMAISVKPRQYDLSVEKIATTKFINLDDMI